MPGGPPTCWASRSTSGTWPSGSRPTSIDDFVAEYAAGRTPNPCLRCNEKIKFSALLDKATALGFDAVCTGHYARIEVAPAPDDGVAAALAAAGGRRGQGPVLRAGRADPRAAGRCDVPARRHGARPRCGPRRSARGLAVATKADSHDICFIADGDTAAYLADRLGSQPGEFVDESGTVVGRHDGAYAFTVGQRHGLHLGVPAADGTAALRAGHRAGQRSGAGRLARARSRSPTWSPTLWSSPPASSRTGLGRADAERRCLAQVRAHAEPVSCVATYDGERLTVRLDEPVRGVAAGQGLALYDGDRVLAAGRIACAT